VENGEKASESPDSGESCLQMAVDEHAGEK
jgi:hypothetical protein